MKEKKKLITLEDVTKMLDTCYDKSLHGINKVSPPIDQFANDYLNKEFLINSSNVITRKVYTKETL